jgi:hypothetical protein
VAEQIRLEVEQQRAAVVRETDQVREFRDGLLDDLGRVHGEIGGLLERTRKQRDEALTAGKATRRPRPHPTARPRSRPSPPRRPRTSSAPPWLRAAAKVINDLARHCPGRHATAGAPQPPRGRARRAPRRDLSGSWRSAAAVAGQLAARRQAGAMLACLARPWTVSGRRSPAARPSRARRPRSW